MATLYPGSTNHKETMSNLFWRNPSAGSEPAVSGNMVYLNFSSPLAGIRNPGANSIDVSDLASSHLGENFFSSWRDRRNMMLFEGAHSGSLDDDNELIRSSATDDDPHMAIQTQLSILNEHNLSFQKSMYGGQGQGLSLSLGMQIPVPSFKYQPAGSVVSVLNTNQSIPGDGEAYGNENSRSRSLNSKYIKAAQQLLDEIVNLQKALKHKAEKTKSVNVSGISAWKDSNGGSRSDGKLSEYQESSAELLPSDKPELQNKMRKLMVMLEEVNRRYKQYFNEMQIVDSSFDAIAGTGAAKSYTALALQAISRHFRCLRDAIDTQIRSSQKLLWQDDGSSGKGCVISRLRYTDQHLRQQRAIQQLGVVPQHSWRPQRGLPENSVSILRAWLFEHFLHPYPNDSEKLMLARQAGLTRSQISNWFINARVRLWKPMIEHIYREEFGDNEMDSNSSSENETKYIDELCSNAQEDHSLSIERLRTNHQSCQLNLISEPDTAARAPVSENKLADLRPHGSSFINPLLHDAICHANELERYNNGGGVSLALGLQHCDGSLPVSEAPSIGFGSSQLLKYFVA